MGKLTNRATPGIKRNSVENIIDFIARNQYIYITMICIALFPVFWFRDVTPNNELRYVSIIEESLRDGHFFALYNQGQAYADKPPLYFWLMMAGYFITGKNLIIFSGIINLLTFSCILYVMNKWCESKLDRKSAMAAALTLTTTGMFSGIIIVMRMDLLMILFIILTLYTFFKMYEGRASRMDSILLPVYIFLAVFSKGPVGLLMPLICIPAFLICERKIKSIWKYLGWRTWGILALLFMIWSAAIYIEAGKDYLMNIMFRQTVDRSVGGVHHKEPIYYYLTTILPAMLPWSPFIVAVFVKSFFRKQFFKDSLSRFFFIIIVCTFIMLSLSSSKLSIYLLPIYPFVIYLTFILLKRIKAGIFIRIATALPAISAIIAAIMLPFIYDTIKLPMPPAAWCIPVFSVIALIGVVSAYRIFRKNILKGIISMASGILIIIFIASFKIPQYNYLVGWRDVSEIAAQMAAHNNIETVATMKVGRSENMDVYLERDIVKLENIDDAMDDNLIKRPYVMIIKTRDYLKYRDEGYLTNVSDSKKSGKFEVFVVK